MALHSRLILSGCVATLLFVAGTASTSSAQQAPASTATSGLAALAAIAPVVDCTSLSSADISGPVGAPTHIDSATAVPDGKPAPYCEVKGHVDAKINFVVRLPLAKWTQRFMETGCGGLCGWVNVRTPSNADGCIPATNGELVLASSDMGHGGNSAASPENGTWGATDYQARIDFAYRGVHVTALAAKALIVKYYGQAPKYSYFDGCSDGGREALMEMQRFPKDFNGIISGDAALNFTTQNTYFQAWGRRTNTGADGKAIFTEDKVPLLHKAVLDQCDAADSVKDGLISDPLACHFDPVVIQCKPDQDPATCLTPEQVRVVRDLYMGAHDSAGKRLIVGGGLPGSEVNWVGRYAPAAGKSLPIHGMANNVFKYLAHWKNPPESTTVLEMGYDRAGFESTTELHALYDATDPDVSEFVANGGKLIQFHGLTDPGMPPWQTILYYTEMQKVMGKSTVDKFARLYLFPGGNHCSGGEGPFRVDFVSALMAWVEKSQAPYKLIASHLPSDSIARGSDQGAKEVQAETPDRTRPVFPYPLTAKYIGTGSTDEAKNFVEGQPSLAPESLADWYGSSFYTPHYELWCTGNGATMDCKKTQ